MPANDGTVTQEIRPKRREKRTRRHVILLRVNEAEWARIQAAAERTGEQVTPWARRLLLQLAGEPSKVAQLSLLVDARKAGGTR